MNTSNVAETPRKVEVIAVNGEKISAAGILKWRIRPDAVNISYGHILDWSMTANELNNNTREN